MILHLIYLFKLENLALYFSEPIVRILMSFLTSIVLCFILLFYYVRLIRRFKCQQLIRSDGPSSHYVKKNTITMGGCVLIFAIGVSVILWSDLKNLIVLYVFFIMITYGLVGFYDDFRKISYQNSIGLPAKYKFFFQMILAIAIMVMNCVYYQDTDLDLVKPIFIWGGV